MLWVTVALSLAARATAAPAPDLGTDDQRAAGKKLYDSHCSQCHGEKGDGQGVAAAFLLPRPRDFTKGKFKIRTTPSGKLPTDADLHHIIKVGMPYTSMPAWPHLTDAEIDNLVAYVKSFSPEFAKPDGQVAGMEMPKAPALTKESVERGKTQYAELGCAGCHGELGRTDGTTAPTLKDDFGHAIRPADLTRPWTFRGGGRREDIFRTVTTGLNGTPMPAFGEALSVEQRWDLTDFIYALAGSESPNYAALLTAKKTTEEIDLAKIDALFEQAPPAYFPIVGQIMQPGRAFHPASTGLTARAVYNDTDVAIELRCTTCAATRRARTAPISPCRPTKTRVRSRRQSLPRPMMAVAGAMPMLATPSRPRRRPPKLTTVGATPRPSRATPRAARRIPGPTTAAVAVPAPTASPSSRMRSQSSFR